MGDAVLDRMEHLLARHRFAGDGADRQVVRAFIAVVARHRDSVERPADGAATLPTGSVGKDVAQAGRPVARDGVLQDVVVD